ncbi:anti-phage ZorAB system protein ZorA [Nitrosococcus watsonii]|uniref:MotA/TolQ/ExbB proton channel domain-containing protein n=1 Tax=Nitrosococcus watsoni (strain C-113) TaxID=105559 RepID=D8K760_NITWC|nr:anti-phage ZorAB system protein ZorA [Nitrosococcus watsonii]ADJ28737.1 conserved hypothetical protein [Nitrosococcus watsonii C-113]
MNPEEEKFNWAGLLPDFRTLGYPDTPEKLSALFVAVLFAVVFLFLCFSGYRLFKAWYRTSRISKFLKNETSKSVLMNRQDLREKASRVNDEVEHLWKEFDETLVETRVGDDVHLHSIYEASHFFNGSTLARGITESRMLAAVPGFLTALGVIGTFMGLQLGLSELNIGNEAAVKDMKAGLAHVISGAKIAFLTSVWGVMLSVFFNFVEKLLECWALSGIHRLQVRIDQLFPRFSAEVQLQKIADDGSQARESLQGMAERIGDKMQESLLEATSGIQQGLEASLEKIMAPAINKLVNETTDGSQKALEKLVEGFLDRFGEQGEIQRQAMDTASKGVEDALAAMNQTLEGFIRGLDQNQVAAADREQRLIKHISDQVDELVEKNTEHGQRLATAAEQQIGKIAETLQHSQQAQEEREIRLGEKLSEVAAGMDQTIAQLIKHISERVDELVEKNAEHGQRLATAAEQQIGKIAETLQHSQQAQEEREIQLGKKFSRVVADMDQTIAQYTTASNALMEQGKQLQQQVAASQSNFERVAHGINAGAAELRSAASQLKDYGEGVKQSSIQLSGALNEAARSTAKLADENKKSSVTVGQVHQEMSHSIEKLQAVAAQLESVVQAADSTFKYMEVHQKSYLDSLKRNVQELSEQGAKLLSDYAGQANAQTKEHLNIWAGHTTNYAEQMNGAARALSSVVDEIEDKLSH